MNSSFSDTSVIAALREGDDTMMREFLDRERSDWVMDYVHDRWDDSAGEGVFSTASNVLIDMFANPAFEIKRPLTSYLKDVVESQSTIGMVLAGKEHRKRAMREMAENFREPIERFLRTKIGTEEVRDLASQSMVMVIENIIDGKFKGRSSVETYLWSMVRNQVKKSYSRKETASRHEEALAIDEYVESPEVGFIRKELQEKVGAVMERLGGKCQQVLRMWLMKYKMKEIADDLGYANESVVRNTKKRCFQKLETLIEENPEVKRLLIELS